MAIENDRNLTNRFWVYALFIILVLLTFVGIFDHDLWNPEEPRAAELSREFLDPGHSWAVPTLNNEPFIEKPPLVYWVSALSMKVFGVHDWSARLPVVLFGWGILLFTYLLGRRLYGRGVGFASALILLTTFGFLTMSHRIECNIGLMFFIAGAAYFFYRAVKETAWWYVPFYAFTCGAFFCKGFIAFVFLGLLFLAWVIWTGNYRELGRARPWLGIPLLSIPILIWFYFLALDPRDNLLYTFVVENHLHRFFATDNHYYASPGQPFYYYLIQLPAKFAPWIIILLVAIPWLWAQRKESPVRFLLSWFIPGFLFLSAAGTKLGTYLGPILPPLAILVAAWIAARAKIRWVYYFVAGIGMALIIAAFVWIPRLNEVKSYRPFCEELSARLEPNSKLYGFVPEETSEAVIPFYTRRYFLPITTEAEVAELARKAESEVVIVTLENPKKDDKFRILSKYFPYVWQKRVSKDQGIMWAFSNVRK